MIEVFENTDRDNILSWLYKPSIWVAACGSVVGVTKPEDVLALKGIIFLSIKTDGVDRGFVACVPFDNKKDVLSVHCSLSTVGTLTFIALKKAIRYLKNKGYVKLVTYYASDDDACENITSLLGFTENKELASVAGFTPICQYTYKQLYI